MEQQYLEMMTQYKYDLVFYKKYYQRYSKIEMWSRIIVALLSAEFVANIAFWKTHAEIWAILIFALQAYNLIIDLLPFKKRLKELIDMRPLLEGVYGKIEHDWWLVHSGGLKNEQINDLRSAYVKEWQDILKGYFVDDDLPENKKIAVATEAEKETFFANLKAAPSLVRMEKPIDLFAMYQIKAGEVPTERMLTPRQLSVPKIM